MTENSRVRNVAGWADSSSDSASVRTAATSAASMSWSGA